MRTTIELPDELLERAQQEAAESGLTLTELFVSALEWRLSGGVKVRSDVRTVDGPPNMPLLSREETDEAMFG